MAAQKQTATRALAAAIAARHCNNWGGAPAAEIALHRDSWCADQATVDLAAIMALPKSDRQALASYIAA